MYAVYIYAVRIYANILAKFNVLFPLYSFISSFLSFSFFPLSIMIIITQYYI